MDFLHTFRGVEGIREARRICGRRARRGGKAAVVPFSFTGDGGGLHLLLWLVVAARAQRLNYSLYVLLLLFFSPSPSSSKSVPRRQSDHLRGQFSTIACLSVFLVLSEPLKRGSL